MFREIGTLEIGAALGDRYAIVRTIARGGMGEVYLATDRRLNRQVAIKTMRADNIGPVEYQRFEREIDISGRLSHPNIVPVYDSGNVGSIIYYVMPFEEGESLRDRIKREIQLPLDDALRITSSLADAIGYAHSQGILHRDIKPENVILQAENTFITDFGIAKFLKPMDGDSLTSDQTTVGTLAYMSPEQASATKSLDVRSDLYSLALLLYEMLAGELPFRAATPEAMLARKAIGRYPPLRDVRSAVPLHIDEAIARALQPVPADRFRSIADFARALRSPRRTKLFSLRTSLVTAVSIIAVAAGGFLFARFGLSSEPAGASSLGRVIVAPFENRTGDRSIDVVGLMASDWITDGLQKTGIVEVVPVTTAMPVARYVQSARDRGSSLARLLASETGAGTVVTGIIYRQDSSLLFRASIADKDGTRLLGTITDVATPLTNPVHGVEQIRNKLMGWLAVRYDDRLQPPGLASARAPSYEAYRSFSEGMTQYIDVANAKALPHFLEAYSLDSTFTVALLYASIAASNLGSFSRADSLLSQVDARRNELSEYHRAWLDYRIGFVQGNRAKALAAIRIAARDAPQSKASYNHALEAFYSGYFSEALAAIKSIAPDRGAMRGFAPYWEFYGTILHALGQYRNEIEIGKRSRALYPDRLTSFRSLSRGLAATQQIDSLASVLRLAKAVTGDPVGWDYAHMLTEVAEELKAHGNTRAASNYFIQAEQWLLARRDSTPSLRARHVRALIAIGRLAEARRNAKMLRAENDGNIEYLALDGTILARSGLRAEAQAVLDSLTPLRKPYQTGLANFYCARIAALLGDNGRAVEALQQSFAEGRSYDLSLHRDIDLERLRGYAPFDQLIRGRD